MRSNKNLYPKRLPILIQKIQSRNIILQLKTKIAQSQVGLSKVLYYKKIIHMKLGYGMSKVCLNKFTQIFAKSEVIELKKF